MALIPLRAMVRKDLQVFFTDRRAVIMSFAAPILIASFFGAMFGGSGSTEPSRVAIMVSDQDNGTISKAIVASIQSDRALAVTIAPADSARNMVRRGKTTVTVVIPRGFGDAAGLAFFSGRNKPQLELLYDPSHVAELAMVRGMLTGHVLESVSKEAFSGTRGPVLVERSLAQLDSTGLPPAQQQRLRDLLTATRNLYQGGIASGPGAPGPPGMTIPYTVNEQAATSNVNVAYNGYAHSFAGMGIQFLLFAAIDLGIGILLERQRGLWKRLRSAPLSRATLLGGKAASGTLITLMVLLVSFAFAMLVFKVRIHGSVIGFFSVALATALMASTFGLMIASLGKTPSATRGVAILAVLLMVMLGGAWVPTFIFPAWVQKVTVVIPARWAVDGLDAMTWRGVGLDGAVLPTLVLLGFAGLFGALAVLRFQWEEA
jgi:ABC-2 type transport system permease protein